KNLAENIEWIVEPAAKSGSSLRKSSMTVAIVSGAFIGIDQDIVGFAELLKSFLSVRIIWVFVRMKFDRELAIGALDLIFRRAPRDTEHFVIIAFGRWHLRIVMGDVWRLTRVSNRRAGITSHFSLIAFHGSRITIHFLPAGPLETTTVAGRRRRSFKR